MVTGQISFAQVCALMFAGLGFGGYLHNKSWGVWILLIGVIGFILSLMLWVRSLLMEEVPAAYKPLRDRKFVIALRLVGLWLLSFSSSFALIPLYYWLNGNGGHVHGASASMILDSSPMDVGERVSVFFTTDVNTYKLPVKFSIEPENVLLSPGQKAEIRLVIHNPSDEYCTFNILAKPSPSEIQPFVHYDVINKPITIDVAAGSTKSLPYSVHIMESLPRSIGNITIAHFLYGNDRPENWRKMQAGWPNNR
ncbi:MAG: hypothetical protein VX112_04725 [Pseudomonadota bacterium]|nr:hypothetical protein [Pseudomonadota bacterium]